MPTEELTATSQWNLLKWSSSYRNREGLKAHGAPQYGATKAGEKSLKYRRSLYIARDMKAGEKFTRENLRAVRPGFGLATKL